MTKKSYNKFVATAATATLVASAIAPVAASADSKQFTDVNERYAPAVDYVVSKGVQGKTSTQFGVQDSIKRVDAAVFIANALDLNKPGSPDAGFSDVPARAKDAVNALKAKGIINGKTDTRYGTNDVLTRGEVALILASAYNLKGDANSVKFTDVNKNRYGSAVAGLVEAGVTDGISDTKFGTENPVKRGDLAVFLYKLSGETPEVPSTDGITSVKAINDTKIEVTFGKAIDADLVTEIEKSGKRFVIYDGGQTINTNGLIQSKTISFNSDNKVADVILDGTPKADIKYTVALIDGDNNVVADKLFDFGPLVLKESAEKPSFEVNADQDKVVLNFKTKMNEDALDFQHGSAVNNYIVYEGNRELGPLSDFVQAYDTTTGTWVTPSTLATEKGKWVDSTAKQEVEFKLRDDASAQKFLAGKTYKIHVDPTIKTDGDKELSETERTITVNMPSIEKAQPVAKVARVVVNQTPATSGATKTDYIIVTFDKDITDVNFAANQMTLKTPGGDRLDVEDALDKAGAAALTPPLVLSEKEIAIPVDASAVADGSGFKWDNALDVDLTYTLDLPANGAVNAYFPNAANKATSSIKAIAQKDIEVKSVTAKLVQQVDHKNKADLLLTFDQRVNVAAINALTTTGNFAIKDGGDTFKSVAGASLEAELFAGDTSGKTIIIKDVATKFFEDPSTTNGEFIPESGTDYTIEISAQTVKTDAGEDAKVNQEKLKATTGGVSIAAPEFKKVHLNSAEEIVVEFEENVDAKTLKASDITVKGFELNDNGKFNGDASAAANLVDLNGESQIKFSVSGNKLTITPAKNTVKFATSFRVADATAVDDSNKLNLVEIKADALKGATSGVENGVLNTTDLKAVDLLDRAKPIIIGSNLKSSTTDTLEITYSEAIYFRTAVDAPEEKAANQYGVENASRNAYGKNIASFASLSDTAPKSKIEVQFDKADTFKSDLNFAEIKLNYTPNTNVFVKDTKGNDGDVKQTIKGIAK